MSRFAVVVPTDLLKKAPMIALVKNKTKLFKTMFKPINIFFNGFWHKVMHTMVSYKAMNNIILISKKLF